MEDSVFTKIIKGEIPCYKIGETEHCFAFLDIRPLTKGHTLVIPKTQIDYLFDLPDELLARLMSFAKRVAKAIESIVDCKRVGLLVVGTEVPHAHIHLIPFQKESQLNIKNNPVAMSQAELENLALQIAKVLESAQR